MELTAKNVEDVAKDCLFTEAEKDELSKAVKAEGPVYKYGFHPERLESHREDIRSMLEQLPEDFQKGKGGGMSFLNACMTKDGVQWGQHFHVEVLLCLGLATGQAGYCAPKSMWSMLPGGMPYFWVGGEENETSGTG